jgi:hypothetical protein
MSEACLPTYFTYIIQPMKNSPEEIFNPAEAFEAFQDIVANKANFIGKELSVHGDGAEETTKYILKDIEIWNDAMLFIIDGKSGGGSCVVPSIGTKVWIHTDTDFSIESDPHGYSCSA